MLILNYCSQEDVITFFHGKKLREFADILDDLFSGEIADMKIEKHFEFVCLLHQAIDISTGVFLNPDKVLKDIFCDYKCSSTFDTACRLYSSDTPPSQLFNVASRTFSERVITLLSDEMEKKAGEFDNGGKLLNNFLHSTRDIFTEKSIHVLPTFTPLDFVSFVRKTFDHFFASNSFDLSALYDYDGSTDASQSV